MVIAQHTRPPRPVSVLVKLPLPPSVNRTYKIGRNRKTGRSVFYRDAQASAWLEDAITLLRAGGVRPVGGAHWTYSVRVYASCSLKRDVDAGAKLILDAVAEACQIDDKHCSLLRLQKNVQENPEQQELRVVVDMVQW